MIRFACPGCSATFTVGDEKAGKTGKCPKCQSQFVIPAADAGAPSADLPPPPPPPAKSPSRPSAPPLPPPPPAADPNAPVEIAPCPKCGTRLSVLPTDVGVDIQCPSCETVFRATRADAPPPPDTGSKSKGSSALVKLGSGSDKDDDDDDDRPSKKKKSRRGDDDDDDDDDRPSRRRSSRRDDDDDEDEDDRPSKRNSRRSRRDDDDDYEEDEDSRPSRRSRRSSRKSKGPNPESKRMVAGILALLVGAFGVHKFYLGYTTAGILQLLLTFCTYVGAFLPIIEGIIYLTKSDDDFIETYQHNEKQWF